MSITSTIITVGFSPFLFTCALLLLPFAITTTFLAIVTLTARALVVYFELFTAIVQNEVEGLLAITSSSRPPSISRSKSNSSNGSQTPKPTYNAPPFNATTTRDFEGVGGWRFAVENDENDNEWLTMNSRLQLPGTPRPQFEIHQRRHQRSLTGGSFIPSRTTSKRSGSTRPKSAVMSGTVSPEDTFAAAGRVKSMIALGTASMNIGKIRDGSSRRKDSTSSSGSGRTLTIAETAT